MRYKFIFFCLIFSFLTTAGIVAQEAPGLQDILSDSSAYTPVTRYRAFGLSYRTTKDKALSPLVFSGPGALFATSSWKYRKNWLWQSESSSRYNLLQNEPASSILNETGFSYRISALKELTGYQKGAWRFWAGPEAGMLLNFRLHSRNVNNVASYDWTTNLGGTAMVSRNFKILNRSFSFSNQLVIPLVFIYARPPYAWGIPPAIFEEQKGSWKEAFQAGTLNNILLLSNQLNLDFYLRKRKKGKIVRYRAMRLSYGWSFFQVKTRNVLQTGGHQLTFSRALTF